MLSILLASSCRNAMYLHSLLLSSSAIILKCLVKFLPSPLNYLLPRLKLACLILLPLFVRSYNNFLFICFLTFPSIKSSCIFGVLNVFFAYIDVTFLTTVVGNILLIIIISSSFRTKDVSPALDVTSFVFEKTQLRYFHQCCSFSGASPLPFLIRLCILDHSCLKDLNLNFYLSIEVSIFL